MKEAVQDFVKKTTPPTDELARMSKDVKKEEQLPKEKVLTEMDIVGGPDAVRKMEERAKATELRRNDTAARMQEV